MTTDQKLVQQFLNKREEATENIQLASYEIFQEIMSKYVKRVLELSEPIAEDLVSEAEELSGEEAPIVDRESAVGMVAVAIWANISNSLQDQILMQSSSEEENVH
jgi:hypothetical protein